MARFPAILIALCTAAAVGTVAPAGATTRPSFLIVLTDDQTFDALDRGSPTVMPQLEGHLADPTDHWIQFPNFFFENPLCCPSRSTILTGLYDFHTGVQTNTQGAKLDDHNTIATRLQAIGYQTALVGKYLNGYPFSHATTWIPPGWDQWFVKTGLKDLGYYDYTLNENGTLVQYHFGTDAYSTDLLASKAAGVITSTPASQPLFLELALAAPHLDPVPAPRDVGVFNGLVPHHDPSFNEADVSDKPAWVRALPRFDPTGVQSLDATKVLHYQTLLAVDDAVQKMLDTLAATGRLDHTVVLFMTDNGFAFGEHRWEGKRCEYDICLRSPFFIRYPGAVAHVDTHLVSNVDIAPTFEALAGEERPPPTDGLSLAPLLTGLPPPSWRSGVLAHNAAEGTDPVPTWWAVRSANYAYVELPTTGETELYDLTGQLGRADPSELQNVAGQPAYAEVQAQLADQLDALRGVDLAVTMTAKPDPSTVGDVVVYDVTVRNRGLGDAHGVALSDPVPLGAALKSVVSTQGTCDGSVTCALGDISAGKKALVMMTVSSTAAGTLTDTAIASSSIPDGNPGDDSATASTTVQPPSGSADLSVVVSDSPDPVGAGGIVTYTVRVTNAGPSPASGVSIRDPVPTGTSFVSMSPTTRCTLSSGAMVCSIGSLAAGTSTSAKLKVTPAAPGTVTDTASAFSLTPDPDSTDLSASEATLVTDPSADLRVAIVDTPDPIGLGSGDLTYVAKVSNLGPASASGVTVVDTLPASVTVVGWSPASRCTLSGSTISCAMGTLGAGSNTLVSILVTPTATGTMTDEATVSSSAPDPNGTNDSATATTMVT